MHPTITIKTSKETLSGDYKGADKSKNKERDQEKENWLVVAEYHLVVTPDAFRSSLEVEFCSETGSDWSNGPADKVRES